MFISKKDYNTLCKIARALNDTEEEEYNFSRYDLWKMLNNVIFNIEEI
jgi:hypothetical protein